MMMKRQKKKKEKKHSFVEINLDVDPFCSYYTPRDRDTWKELRGRHRCNKLYLRRYVDTVETLKILISACFTIDVAVSNLRLRILEETGSRSYRPWELDDDNAVLGVHHAVRNNKLWVWMSKKVDMEMWKVLEYKVDNSVAIEKSENRKILEDAMEEVEDMWLFFVSRNLEKIQSILEFTLWVWYTEGEKEKFCERRELSSGDRTVVDLLEHRSERFDRLRNYVVQRRVIDETELMRLTRKERLHELYYNGNDPRSI